MGTILHTYCVNALKVLAAQFDLSRAVTHGASVGAVREQVIRDFLADHLPQLVTVISGQIFDHQDRRSTQQDVVLALKSVPRLPFASGIDLIYAEGVVATIEIKSSLSGPVLQKIGEGISSVRSLQPASRGRASAAVTHRWPQGRIISAVITHGGSSLPTLCATLDEMTELQLPDIVLDLSQGVLVRNHGFIMPDVGSASYITICGGAEGFLLLLTVLTEITGTLSAVGADWRSYWPKG